MKYGYARVSSKTQDYAGQIEALPFPGKIGALTMVNESTADFRHFSLDQLVCAEIAHGLVSARVGSGPAIATSAAEEVLK